MKTTYSSFTNKAAFFAYTVGVHWFNYQGIRLAQMGGILDKSQCNTIILTHNLGSVILLKNSENSLMEVDEWICI